MQIETLLEYQQLCRTTATYPQETQMQALTYTVLGLTGEAGEIANKFKKLIRGDHGIIDGDIPEPIRQALLGELGDVFWYVAEIATGLNANLVDIATANIKKLADRQTRGTLQGSGDIR